MCTASPGPITASLPPAAPEMRRPRRGKRAVCVMEDTELEKLWNCLMCQRRPRRGKRAVETLADAVNRRCLQRLMFAARRCKQKMFAARRCKQKMFTARRRKHKMFTARGCKHKMEMLAGAVGLRRRGRRPPPSPSGCRCGCGWNRHRRTRMRMASEPFRRIRRRIRVIALDRHPHHRRVAAAALP